MSTLSLDTLELVSVLRTAPANGAPSSLDYYDGEQEKVTDLEAIVTFVNNTLLPLLNALKDSAASGLLGSAIFTDTSSQDALVYDAVSGEYLTVADTARLIYGMVTTVQNQVVGLSQQVAALQARLSSSSQNDVSLALQNITGLLASQAAQLVALSSSVSAAQQLTGTMMDASAVTPAVAAAGGTASVNVDWPIAYADNTYSVTYSIEDASGFLQVSGFSYQANGVGITVHVTNSDPAASHSGTIHAQARSAQISS